MRSSGYAASMKRLLIASLSLLLLLLPVGAAQAQAPLAKKNVGITGMWLGTNSGYENGVYKSSPVRYTVTQTNGIAYSNQWHSLDRGQVVDESRWHLERS